MSSHEGHACSALERLLAGAQRFRTEVFPRDRSLYEELARGQAPHTLFIACADSRVSPDLITQARPGELFVLRNIGNIVPSYGEMLGGVSAVVEYAVSALGVTDVVVCGHTDCGAMKALADPDAARLEEMPTVRSWLQNAAAARTVARTLAARAPGGEVDPMRLLIEQNVLLQLAHLRTHPSVAARMAEGRLFLHGWTYDIENGEIRVTDEASRTTITIEQAQRRLADHE